MVTTAYPARPAPQHAKQRPIGSLCTWCQYRPAIANRRWPHLATNWCSTQHRACEQRSRWRARQIELANDVRQLLGLPADRCGAFTVPELEAMRERLLRVLPYGGLARQPARHRTRKITSAASNFPEPDGGRT